MRQLVGEHVEEVVDLIRVGGGERPQRWPAPARTGRPGKTEFPANWGENKVAKEITSGADDPRSCGHPSRCVPGLRREEVALLAGVSPDYYIRLEWGNPAGVSECVLEAIARALQLDDAESEHLFDLARAASTTPRRRRRTWQGIRLEVQQLLDAMTDATAFVRNGRLDILAINRLGQTLYAPAFETAAGPVNLARFRFLDPEPREFYPDWDNSADAP